MVSTEKPPSVEVTVRNRRTGENKSFPVYDVNVSDAVEIIKKAFEKEAKRMSV